MPERPLRDDSVTIACGVCGRPVPSLRSTALLQCSLPPGRLAAASSCSAATTPITSTKSGYRVRMPSVCKPLPWRPKVRRMRRVLPSNRTWRTACPHCDEPVALSTCWTHFLRPILPIEPRHDDKLSTGLLDRRS